MSRVGVHIRRGAEEVAGVPWTASGPVPVHRSRRAATFLSRCRRRWRRRRRGFGTHSGHGHGQMAPSSDVVGGPGQRRGRAWVGRQRRTRPGPAGDEVLFRQWPSLKSGRGRQWLFCHSRWRGARDLLPLLFPTQTPAFRSPGRYLPSHPTHQTDHGLHAAVLSSRPCCLGVRLTCRCRLSPSPTGMTSQAQGGRGRCRARCRSAQSFRQTAGLPSLLDRRTEDVGWSAVVRPETDPQRHSADRQAARHPFYLCSAILARPWRRLLLVVPPFFRRGKRNRRIHFAPPIENPSPLPEQSPSRGSRSRPTKLNGIFRQTARVEPIVCVWSVDLSVWSKIPTPSKLEKRADGCKFCRKDGITVPIVD